jgi:hypothetical protein
VKAIRFGEHALRKFDDLRRYKVCVTREQVERVLRQPDRIEPGEKGRQIATGRFAEHLVLRVVYREADDAFEVVTFYPGRRSRYGTTVR